MRNKLVDKIIENYKTNLVNHLYFMLLKVQNLNLQLTNPEKKTQVVNVYDNQIERGCALNGKKYYTKRALKIMNLRSII